MKIENIKLVKDVIEKDIKLPYYGWWSHKKEECIKIDYDNELKPKQINYVIATNGFGIRTSIYGDYIPITNDVVDKEINQLLLDYDTEATEQEFDEFKLRTINKLNLFI